MRYFSVFFFLFTALFSLSAQPGSDYWGAVEERWNAYVGAAQEQDFDRMAGYVYPSLFTQIPREEWLRENAEAVHHPDLDIRLSNFQLGKIGEPVEASGDFFLRLDYSHLLTVGFKEGARWDQDFIDDTLERYSEAYGEQNVRYDKAKGQLLINAYRSLVAVLPNALLEWYFLDPYDGRGALVGELLPAIIRSHPDFDFSSK